MLLCSVFFCILFLVNLVLFPLYGWILSEQMRINLLPHENLLCVNATMNTWGIWATGEFQCGDIRLLYPPFPQILNPHDIFKVRKWISRCQIEMTQEGFVAFVDHDQHQAFTNGFEIGLWGNLVVCLFVIDGVTLCILVLLCFTEEHLHFLTRPKPIRSFMVFPQRKRRDSSPFSI